MAFTFVQVTVDSPALVADFQRDANAQFLASVLDGVLDSDEMPAQQKTQVRMLLNLFDKNKNGRIDPEERPALIDFLRKQMPQK
jgi:hypothetical protein